MADFSESFASFLRGLETVAPVAIVIAAFVDGIIVIGFVLNGALLLGAAMYFLSQGSVSFPELVLCAAVGALLGDHLGYWIGRSLGRRAFSWWPLKHRPRLREKMDYWLARYGALGLVVGRFFPPTRCFAPFVAASAGMKYRPFAYANLLACTAWAAVWCTLALLIVNGYVSVTG